MSLRVLFIFTFLCLLTGCSTLVADYIGDARSYQVRPDHLKEMMQKYAYSKHRFCDEPTQLCISYLKTSADKDSPELIEKHEVDFGKGNENINLNVQRENLPDFKGTIVVLHGYRGSKEWMSITGGYFRFLGFDVLMPDLLGHGESQGQISFGVQDAEILLRWIKKTIPENEPLLMLANSMGAVSAVNMVAELPNLKGLILQAPMRRFDEAVVAYADARGTWMTRLIPEESLKTGARKALSQKDVNVSETDIKLKLQKVNIPVLIFASDSDFVAPYEHFIRWDLANTAVHLVKSRSHPAMALIDQSEHEKIIDFVQVHALNSAL